MENDYHEMFKRLKFESIDDLPPHRVNFTHKNYQMYKCRNNFLSILLGYIWLYKDTPSCPEQEVGKLEGFINQIVGIGDKVWKEKGDIEVLNGITDYMFELTKPKEVGL